jgi:hypothetical protein
MRTPSLLGVYLRLPEWLIAAAGLLILAIYAWRGRREHANSVSFGFYLALALALTLLVIPTVVQPFNHILLLPAVLLCVLYWKDLRQCNRLFRIMCSITCLVGLLPWLFAAAVTIGLLFGPLRWLLRMWFFPLNASLATPFAAFCILVLLRRVVPLQSTS